MPVASRFDLAYPHTKRDLAGHDPNGTVDDDRGAFTSTRRRTRRRRHPPVGSR